MHSERCRPNRPAVADRPRGAAIFQVIHLRSGYRRGRVQRRRWTQAFGDLPAERLASRLMRRASDPHALNTIGRYYAMRQQPATGLNFAIRAVRADPGCGGCWDTAALLYYQVGKVAEAVKAQERAVGLYGEAASPDVMARLRRYRGAAQPRAGK